MSRDQRKLLKALQRQSHVTSLQARMANIILQCNGIVDALQYVKDLPGSQIPLQAAFWDYVDKLNTSAI